MMIESTKDIAHFDLSNQLKSIMEMCHLLFTGIVILSVVVIIISKKSDTPPITVDGDKSKKDEAIHQLSVLQTKIDECSLYLQRIEDYMDELEWYHDYIARKEVVTKRCYRNCKKEEPKKEEKAYEADDHINFENEIVSHSQDSF